MNGVAAADFALDLGLAFKRFLALEGGAVEALATVAGLDAAAVEGLLSWTARPIGAVRMEFRGEVFVSRALRSPRMRGCPVCLREDVRGQESHPAKAMALRGDWQLREVSLCVRHAHPLVTLWEEQVHTDRHAVGARLRDIAGALLEGRLDAPPVTPSPYDLWLDARLDGGRDDTWLAGQSLFAATTFCRLLGAELLRLEDLAVGDPAAHRRAAQAAGFDMARQGPEAVNAALDRLAAQADGAGDGPKKAFGRLFDRLSQEYRDEPAFNTLRDLLRDRILAIWPVDPGTEMLGKVVAERRLHSVATAAREAGIGPVLMEQFLVEAGAVTADDPRPAARKTFEAGPQGPLLTTIPQLVGSLTMRRTMGASRAEFRAIEEDGIVRPRTGLDVKAPWHPDDGQALVAELTALAVPVAAGDPGWEPIQRAKIRTGLGVGTIIGAIREGRLQVGSCPDRAGYGAFMVRRDAVDRMAPRQSTPTADGLVPAAAFGL